MFFKVVSKSLPSRLSMCSIDLVLVSDLVTCNCECLVSGNLVDLEHEFEKESGHVKTLWFTVSCLLCDNVCYALLLRS